MCPSTVIIDRYYDKVTYNIYSPLLRSSPYSAAPRPTTLPSARYKGGCVATNFISMQREA